MRIVLYTLQGQSITLSAQLGSGGQGAVYEVEGQPNVVAKRYHKPPAPEQAARLIALAQRNDERLMKIAAWPTDVLFDQPGGAVTGFLMPRVDGASEIHALHSPKSRLQKFPDATWAFLMHTAANIARAIATVHEAGFIIGDVNPKNVLVTRQATVALLDCDSFQFAADGVTYRCEAGFPEYTPPELQGVVFRDVDRTAQHDAFGLAVAIFQLLFLGRHPFAGKFLGEGEMSLGRAIAEGRFAYGEKAAARQMQAPPGTLPWPALPPAIAEHFERSFLTTERVTPREWIETLDAVAQTLVICALHQGHRYAAGLAACPWCEIEMRARVKLFHVTRKGEGQPSAFRLDEVWREIEQIKAPDLLKRATQKLKAAQPSGTAQSLADTQRNGFLLALLATAAGGFATSYLGGFCAFVGLGWLALLIANYCLKLEPRGLAASFNPPTGTLAESIKQARDEAAARVRQLEQQWEWDVNGRFAAKRNELKQHRKHYATLDTTRNDRLQQLEAAARRDHTQAHLETFEMLKGETSGYVLTRYLRTTGIKTAADITPERLNATPLLTQWQKEKLLDWRKQKEKSLRLDRNTLVHPMLRHRVLTETEAMRERLEAELRSGALYLRRLRNEVETAQLAVRDELLKAKQALAQAEADYKMAGKRHSLGWPIAVFVLAGFIGGVMGKAHEISQLHLSISPIEGNKEPMNAEAHKFYDEAINLRNEKNYDQALGLLLSANNADASSETIWDALGYTYYLAGQYDQAIKTAEASLPFTSQTFSPYRNRGLGFAAKKMWAEAKINLQTAVNVTRSRPMNREMVEMRFALAQTLHALKEWPAAAKPVMLNQDVSHLDESDRVLLVFYRLWSKGQMLEGSSSIPEISLHQDTYELMKEFFQRYEELNKKSAKKTNRRARR